MKNRSKNYKKIVLTLIVILDILLIIGILYWYIPSQKTLDSFEVTNSKKNNVSQVQNITGRYLFNGTVVWARAVEKDSLKPDGSYDYNHPFSQLDTFNREAYDAWVTDFECPITKNVVPFQTQINDLIFNCRPEFLPYATKYFNIFNFANNHSDNQNGQVGLDESRATLDGFPETQYFGTFDSSVTKDICEVIALPVNIVKSDKTNTKDYLPVAFCGWHYFLRNPNPGEIEVMKKYAEVMPVFAFSEMGLEYQAQASGSQIDNAHKIIDAGSEFLVANNPHWVQNTEVYKNKLIIYSTGNFIFDQIEPETQRSVSLDVIATVKYDDNIKQWLTIGKDCLKFQDDCLEKAKQKRLKKPKLSYKFGIVAGQGGNKKVTHKADEATQKEVELRTNWVDTCSNLPKDSCQ